MAWRIDENVVHGEIDNRKRGRVIGRIWLAGRAAPIELDLAGNAWRDLAGRRLAFVNPRPVPCDLENFAARQTGVIGDCTASRKVKVPDIPLEQIDEYYAARKPIPWHWSNSLYLEWFSTPNGRVVIESASFELTITGDVAWEMTVEEEEAQRRANAEAMVNFLGRICGAAGAGTAGEPSEEDAGEVEREEKPQTEEEADKMLEESDRLADRINARVAREGEELCDRIIKEELERRRQERGERPPTAEEKARHAEWLEELNRAAADALANPDPEIEAVLDRKHPLAERAFEFSIALRKEPKKRGWIPADAMEEHPVADLINSVACAAMKFAGALDGEEWPPEIDFCAMVIARLKRARGYLDHALLAAEFCSERRIVDADWVAGAQREINALGRECDLLIGELRAKLARGFD